MAIQIKDPPIILSRQISTAIYSFLAPSVFILAKKIYDEFNHLFTEPSNSADLIKIEVMESLNKTDASPLAPYTSVRAWKRARSLARIKVSAFGAGDRGFKSHRARFFL